MCLTLVIIVTFGMPLSMNLSEDKFSISYIPFSENSVKNHILLDSHPQCSVCHTCRCQSRVLHINLLLMRVFSSASRTRTETSLSAQRILSPPGLPNSPKAPFIKNQREVIKLTHKLHNRNLFC